MDGAELATWALVAATLVYAFATILLYLETRGYSSTTRDLVLENRKVRVQPIVYEIADRLLYGKIRILDQEVFSEQNDFDNIRRPKEAGTFQAIGLYEGLTDLNLAKQIFLKNLLKEQPELRSLMLRHDELVNELEKSNAKLFSAIYTQEFITVIQQSLEEYSRRSQAKIDYPVTQCALDLVNYYPKRPLFQHVLDLEPHPEDKAAELWYGENEDLLKQFCVREEIKQIMATRDHIFLQLKGKAKELRDKFMEVREKLTQDYML